MALVQIKEVSKQYSNHLALDRISCEVPEGSIFGLLGPNGAGKTSLIRIINQITGPDSGEILFEGEKLAEKHVRQIGYLPEERGLYKKMEVGEQAIYLARLKGLSRNDALEKLKYWFEKFEIKPWWKKKVEELSKGMQQKVQFIITVLHEPKLLILDEPFSGFDPINTQIIRDELLRINKTGTAIILSTHRMESVEELCTNISLLNNAKILLQGEITEIKNKFRNNTYLVDYMGNSIGLANSLWVDFNLIDSEQSDGMIKARIRIKNEKGPNDLLKAMMQYGDVHSFRELVPSMNEIFIKIVQEDAQAIAVGANE